ncbi:bile acid:sodium symporter [Gordonia sp. CPCC 205333]|uniref:bile acid:sodium symporter n=1 Tax=Gordonia sp. CPCC 205333 TaxID=3140790 RepID=UPI003AF37FB5
MPTLAERMEHHQVLLYLAAIVAGVGTGLAVPDVGPTLEHFINPALGLLLYVTFLQVPAASLVAAIRDGRFMTAIVVVNFVVVPLVVAAMFTFLPSDQALRVGVLLVLLCPCVDYVIVFSGLAGGDARRLLAATPMLLLLQMLLLPLFLWAYMGSDLAAIIDVGPFLNAFGVLIVIPLALAWATQWWSTKHTSGRRFSAGISVSMVPLMMLVLAIVTASQVPTIRGSWTSVVAAIPVYVTFLIVMGVGGVVVGLLLQLDTAGRRAVIFSGGTRNSLVVLPLALALPAGFEVAAAVVVTQTLIEVIGMVIYVRVVPRLVPPTNKRDREHEL